MGERTMEEIYKKSFAEVYEILKIIPMEILNKIPQKLKDIIEKERDRNYHVIIKEPLNIEDFQYETIVFLGMIYRDFLCSEEERKNLQEEDIQLRKKYEEELRQKYNTDNLFNKRQKSQENDIKKLPTEMKEKKWYKKLLDLIKGVLK